MAKFQRATVTKIIEERRGLQRVETNLGHAYVLTEPIGAVQVSDDVILNTTAVELGLGTGDWHVVHWNLSHSGETQDQFDSTGHILKMRYTSLQTNVSVIEEAATFSSVSLNGIPVVVCSLHSQLAVVVAAAVHVDPEIRIGYVMTDTAALPYALSDIAFELLEKNLIVTAVSCGQAFGAPVEAVNVASAMAGIADDVDMIVVAPGIGVVGTATELGFSSLANASELDFVRQLGGHPIYALRYSDADQRSRHRGLSHHSRTVLKMTQANPTCPVPMASTLDLADAVKVDVPEIEGLMQKNGLVFYSMGRDASVDPGFFQYAAAAGVYGAHVAQGGGSPDDSDEMGEAS